jgi:predicted nucleotidyltransferase
MPAVSRQQIIDTLGDSLREVSCIRGAWLGGSDASGRTDEWSDIDLAIIAEDDRIEETYERVHAALETLSPIELSFRFPMPTWHGHEQEILRLRDAGPWAIVDLVIMAKSNPNRFLERERHGEPLILFDHDGLVVPSPLDRAKHLEMVENRVAMLRTRFELFQSLVSKAALRGAGADAIYSYQALTHRPLIELLRIRYCPQRFDYGPRYLDRDLPADLRAQVEELAYVPSVDRIEEYRARVEVLFRENLGALEAGEWRVELPPPAGPGRD